MRLLRAGTGVEGDEATTLAERRRSSARWAGVETGKGRKKSGDIGDMREERLGLYERWEKKMGFECFDGCVIFQEKGEKKEVVIMMK
ncbi:hypothetical protein L6452_17084 [Arctium lappa]|uniref:Uncharacterized protein n=1 Tax=Arctium lappa TaxID=4217 RepID=A0ACB9C299_ARCLA|nr:hypothetical protein L6452_17084 [Arctium lappa]